MRYILVILLMMSGWGLYGQDTLFYNGDNKVESKEACTHFQVNENNKKKPGGTKKVYFKNGNKCAVYTYIDENGADIPDGKRRLWFENGKKKQVAHFKYGHLNGKVRSYYANGQIKRKDVYKEGKLMKGRYWDQDGKRIAHKPYYVKAEYIGGTAQRQKFFSDNLRYPKSARENEVQGKVIVEFVIQKDGTIGNIRVVNSVDEALDLEAKRVIMKMPAWQPATEDDEPAKSYFTLPVQFTLK